MNFVVGIPARYASSRMPGKMLARVGDRSLIERTVDAALRSGAREVIVATDHEGIADHLRDRDCEVVLTPPELSSGTARLAFALSDRGLAEDAVVVNVQGDEPLMPPACIDQVAQLLFADSSADMATLMCPVDSAEQLADPNCVKVVTDRSSHALWFSRAQIPYCRSQEGGLTLGDYRRHIGIYGYRYRVLHGWAELSASRAERLESLEQLRALHHGLRIAVADAVEMVPAGVDSVEDLERVRAIFTQRL